MQNNTYRLTDTVALRFVPDTDGSVKIEPADENTGNRLKTYGHTLRKAHNDLELYAEAALRITRGAWYRAAFRRMTLTNWGGADKALTAPMVVRYTTTWVSRTGYLDMSQESESVEVFDGGPNKRMA